MELEELGEGLLGDVRDGVVAHVQDPDALGVLQGNLEVRKFGVLAIWRIYEIFSLVRAHVYFNCFKKKTGSYGTFSSVDIYFTMQYVVD